MLPFNARFPLAWFWSGKNSPQAVREAGVEEEKEKQTMIPKKEEMEMFRVNRYYVRGRHYWRVWKGAKLIARCPRGYKNEHAMERNLRSLFPHWVTR